MAKTLVKQSADFLAAIVPANGAMFSEHTDAIYTAIDPLHEIIRAVRTRVDDIEYLRRKADAVEVDPQVFAFFERIKQTGAAMLREANVAAEALDRIAEISCQYDRYALEMEKAMNTLDGNVFP